MDIIDEPEGDFKLEDLSGYGRYQANWDKIVSDNTSLLTGTTLNVAAQVANISAFNGIELNNFLGGEFGKVKDYAEHLRKTIGDVNGKSFYLLFCSVLLCSVLLFDTCVLGPACRRVSLWGMCLPRWSSNGSRFL